MNPLLLLNWRLWAALAVAVALAASHYKAYHLGQSGVKADWAAEKLEVARQSMKLMERRDEINAELEDQAKEIDRAKNVEIDALNDDVARLLERLRNRPERPSANSVPKTPGNGENRAGATGAELYSEDAGFSLGEAATAQKLRIHLKACYIQYDEARAKLEAMNKKD